jgi:plastocyanin
MVLRKTTAKALALGVTLTVLAAGCGSGSDPVAATGATSSAAADTMARAALTPVKDGIVEVAYRGYVIEPAEIVVRSGQEIRWMNHDVTRHNVVVKPDQPETFTSEDFDEGGTATYAPKAAGVYAYLCTFHAASMQGTITVQG